MRSVEKPCKAAPPYETQPFTNLTRKFPVVVRRGIPFMDKHKIKSRSIFMSRASGWSVRTYRSGLRPTQSVEGCLSIGISFTFCDLNRYSIVRHDPRKPLPLLRQFRQH